VEKLAEKARSRLLQQVDEKRKFRTAATVSQDVGRYLDQFDGEQRTLEIYRGYANNHIEPLIGKEKVASIDAEILDSFYTELRRCRLHCCGPRQHST